MPDWPGLYAPSIVDAALHPYTKLEGSGHSYVAGNSATGSHGYLAKLGVMLGLSGGNFVNRGAGGACVTSDEQSPAGSGWAYTLQQLPRANGGAPWVPASSLYIVNYGGDDLPNISGSPAGILQLKSGLRTVLSRIRASATGVFEETDGSVAHSANWSSFSSTAFNSGPSLIFTSTNGTTVTLTVPSSFPGGTIALGYTVGAGWGAVYTVTVDGNAAGSIDTRGLAPTWPSGKATLTVNANGAVHRLTGLAPGSHTIVITLSSIASFAYFDYWQVEAPDPPTILLILQPRLTSAGYAVFSGFTYGLTDTMVQAMNVAMIQLAAEFDQFVIPVHTDPLFNANAALFSSTGGDQEHPNDDGHSLLANACMRSAGGVWLPNFASVS